MGLGRHVAGIGGRKANTGWSARAETEEAVVEALLDDLGNPDLFGVGVLGVEEVVPGSRDDSRRNARQRCLPGSQPLIAYPLCDPMPFSPVRRRMIKLPDGELVRRRDLQELILVR